MIPRSVLASKNLVLKLGLGMVFMMLVQACADAPVQRDGAPRTSKSALMRIPDATPKIEKVTKAGNKNPYTVFGKTYYLLSQARGYKARGTASWYGTKFHGRRTANGEVYDMNAMTAAHKTLPIPCYVRVRNTKNNKAIVVRVNDRGPFHGNRLIDLSYAAAVRLGFADQGTASVEIEVLTPGVNDSKRRAASIPVAESRPVAPVTPASNPIPLAVPAKPVANPVLAPSEKLAIGESKWYLQAGAFSTESAAVQLRTRLQYITNLPVNIKKEPATGSSDSVFRVRIGPSTEQTVLQKLQHEMLAVKMGQPFIVSDAN
ncbi:MAG: septal ring lytic transglycosylase RlpA family protein [Pseudomonadales bacterium]